MNAAQANLPKPGVAVVEQVRHLVTAAFGSLMLVSMPISATESSHSLVFYPPLDIQELFSQVKDRQKDSRVFLSTSIQFGTRDEWTNACAWLKAQSEQVYVYYVPRQENVKETKYFCAISMEFDTISQASVVELHSLVSEFLEQFGGAQHAWRVSFENQ